MTDHHALCWLSKRDLTGRLARWSLVCQAYDLKIAHKSRRLHTDADPLSRYPIDEQNTLTEPKDHVMFYHVQDADDRTSQRFLDLVAAQRKVPTWNKIIAHLEDPTRKYRGNFHLDNGVLFFKPTTHGNTGSRLCVPPGIFRKEILQAINDLPIGGHMGFSAHLPNCNTLILTK